MLFVHHLSLLWVSIGTSFGIQKNLKSPLLGLIWSHFRKLFALHLGLFWVSFLTFLSLLETLLDDIVHHLSLLWSSFETSFGIHFDIPKKFEIHLLDHILSHFWKPFMLHLGLFWGLILHHFRSFWIYFSASFKSFNRLLGTLLGSILVFRKNWKALKIAIFFWCWIRKIV